MMLLNGTTDPILCWGFPIFLEKNRPFYNFLHSPQVQLITLLCSLKNSWTTSPPARYTKQLPSPSQVPSKATMNHWRTIYLTHFNNEALWIRKIEFWVLLFVPFISTHSKDNHQSQHIKGIYNFLFQFFFNFFLCTSLLNS